MVRKKKPEKPHQTNLPACNLVLATRPASQPGVSNRTRDVIAAVAGGERLKFKFMYLSRQGCKTELEEKKKRNEGD